MTQNEIIEANKRIAFFLGAKEENGEIIFNQPFQKLYIYKPEDLRFHLSFDWVFEALERLERETLCTYTVKEEYCQIRSLIGEMPYIRVFEKPTLKCIFEAINKFIEGK